MSVQKFLTERERRILREAQLAYRSEGRIYIKVTVILMLDEGFSHQEVVRALGIDRSTAYRHYNMYLEQLAYRYDNQKQSVCWG